MSEVLNRDPWNLDIKTATEFSSLLAKQEAAVELTLPDSPQVTQPVVAQLH